MINQITNGILVNFFVDTLHQLIYHQLCNIQRILCQEGDFTPNPLLPLCNLDLELSVIFRLLLQNIFDLRTLSIIFLSETGPLRVFRSSYDLCVDTGRLECLHSLMSLLIATGNIILFLPGNFRSFLGFSKQTVIAFSMVCWHATLQSVLALSICFFFICSLVGHSDLSFYNSSFLLFYHSRWSLVVINAFCLVLQSCLWWVLMLPYCMLVYFSQQFSIN